MKEAERVCGNWDSWFADVGNHRSVIEFQDDSGI